MINIKTYIENIIKDSTDIDRVYYSQFASDVDNCCALITLPNTDKVLTHGGGDIYRTATVDVLYRGYKKKYRDAEIKSEEIYSLFEVVMDTQLTDTLIISLRALPPFEAYTDENQRPIFRIPIQIRYKRGI